MRTTPLLLLSACAVLALAPSARADKILRTDGKVLDNVTVVEELLSHVIYKRGNNEQTVDSADVLSVEFERKPRLVDEADQAALDGDVFVALDQFDVFVDAQINKATERRKWSVPYSAFRSVEICMAVQDLGGAVSRANRLIKNFPDSRYLPFAYLAKASAQVRMGKNGAAQQTLQEFQGVVTARSLSKRWELEVQLGLILTDDTLGGEARRDALNEVVEAAGGQYPTVANRGLVAIGESFIDESQNETNPQKAAQLAAEAQGLFEQIIKGHKADAEVLAGAYCGVGDALLQIGILEKDNGKVKEAVARNFLKVIVLYKDQAHYVSKAMFQAMRCFQLLEDGERFSEMKWNLVNRFPDSSWAQLAEEKY